MVGLISDYYLMSHDSHVSWAFTKTFFSILATQCDWTLLLQFFLINAPPDTFWDANILPIFKGHFELLKSLVQYINLFISTLINSIGVFFFRIGNRWLPISFVRVRILTPFFNLFFAFLVTKHAQQTEYYMIVKKNIYSFTFNLFGKNYIGTYYVSYCRCWYHHIQTAHFRKIDSLNVGRYYLV